MPAAAQPAYALDRPRGLVLPWWLFNAAPLLLVVGLALELWGPPLVRPSVILGGFLGNAEAKKLKAELGTMQATLAAQNEENARLQKQVMDLQARTERVTEGYKTLYQRATLMGQAMSQAQKKFLELQTGVAKESQDRNLKVAQFATIFTGLEIILGDKQMAAGGLQASRAFTNEATTNINHQLQQSVQSGVAMTNTWLQGLPDANTIDSMWREPRTIRRRRPTMHRRRSRRQYISRSSQARRRRQHQPRRSRSRFYTARRIAARGRIGLQTSAVMRRLARLFGGSSQRPKMARPSGLHRRQGGEISDDFRITCEKRKHF